MMFLCDLNVIETKVYVRRPGIVMEMRLNSISFIGGTYHRDGRVQYLSWSCYTS